MLEYAGQQPVEDLRIADGPATVPSLTALDRQGQWSGRSTRADPVTRCPALLSWGRTRSCETLALPVDRGIAVAGILCTTNRIPGTLSCPPAESCDQSHAWGCKRCRDDHIRKHTHTALGAASKVACKTDT